MNLKYEHHILFNTKIHRKKKIVVAAFAIFEFEQEI